MRRNANVGCHQVGLQSTDRLMLGAISPLEKHRVSDGSQGIPKRENVRIRRPAMQKGNMRGGDGVVVPRVTTELVKAWSICRH